MLGHDHLALHRSCGFSAGAGGVWDWRGSPWRKPCPARGLAMTMPLGTVHLPEGVVVLLPFLHPEGLRVKTLLWCYQTDNDDISNIVPYLWRRLTRSLFCRQCTMPALWLLPPYSSWMRSALDVVCYRGLGAKMELEDQDGDGDGIVGVRGQGGIRALPCIFGMWLVG